VEGAGPVLILQRPDVRSDRRRSGRPGGPSTPTRRARLLASTAARFQVTDLDPGSGGVRRRGQGRRVLGEILDDRGIRSYPKTSGGRGLHVLVPLRRGPTQETVRAFAQDVGAAMAERAPRLVTVTMAKAKRRGRVFADALRNAFGQTIVAPTRYAAGRGRPSPPRSTGTRSLRAWTQLSIT
jgi:DNA primase